MAEPGDPHSPPDGAPQGPEDADLFRDETAPLTTPQTTQRPTWAAPVRPAPETSHDPHAHDDLIGFTSPASLAGTERRAPEPVPEAKVEPEEIAPEPMIAPIPEPEALIVAPTFTTPGAAPKVRDAALEAASDWSVKTPLAAEAVAPTSLYPPKAGPAPSKPTPQAVSPSTSAGIRPSPAFGRADARGGQGGAGEGPEGAMGLYTIYALILFAVPTFGVAAVIGLLMVWMRPRPQQPLARSHFEFQTRTLWIAAIVAVVGAVLIAVNLGVFVLVAMALWVIVRGAWGVMTLAAGKPVSNPRTWMI